MAPITRRWGSWLRDRPTVADALLGAGFVVTDLLLDHLRPAVAIVDTWQELVATVVLFGALALRRRWPWLVYLMQLASAGVLYQFGSYDPLCNVALAITLYTLGTLSGRLCAVIAAAIFPLGVYNIWFIRPEGPPTGAGVDAWLNPLLLSVATVFFGQAVRRYRQAAVKLAEAQRRLANEAVTTERIRIAREIHDLVAHSLGVIAVRAGVGRALADRDTGSAKLALEVIETTSRGALNEMRHLLSALRSPDEEAGKTGPQPGLDQLQDLVATMPKSDIPTDLRVEGVPFPLLPGEELTVYRIVQEALTNVLKHAGSVAVHVSLRYQPDGLEVDVVNDPPLDPAASHRTVPRARLPSTGQGLVGMRERVALYGGSLEAGPYPGGGFRVKAVFPVEVERRRTEQPTA